MALLNQTSKVIVVLVLIVALFALILGLLVGHSLDVVNLNTTSFAANAYGFQARGGNNGEFLDATMYVTSWSPNLDSEKIVISGQVQRNFGALSCATEWRWRVYTTSNGLSWNELSTSPYLHGSVGFTWSTGYVTLPDAPIIQLRGLYVGGLKVDLELHIKDLADPTCSVGIDKGFLLVGEDLAYLRSGVGSVRAPTQAQVGQQVSVCVDIPYVASEKDPGKGWLLYGYSTAQAKEILRVDPIATSGTTCYSYTVAAADFVQSAACTTQNRLEWHLFNELWAKDFAFTTTIDASAFAPSLRVTSISPGREVGSPITIAWNATPNPTTQYPIRQIVLAYGFGAPDNEQQLPGSQTSYTLTPGEAGVLHVEIYAVDSSCRPSPSVPLDIQVREKGQGGAAVPTPDLLLFAIVILIAVVAGAVLAARVDAGLGVRVLLFVTVTVVGLLIAVFVVPTILFPGG